MKKRSKLVAFIIALFVFYKITFKYDALGKPHIYYKGWLKDKHLCCGDDE